MMRDSTGQLFTVSGFASDLQFAFQSFLSTDNEC